MTLTSTITLANSIIGVSILAMPFCFKQCGIVLATFMLLLSGMLVKVACHLLLKSALMARRRTMESLAFHTHGHTGKLLVELGIIGYLTGTAIAFFVVMGDLGPPMVAKLGGIELTANLRMVVLTFLALFVALPLSLLKDLQSLQYICTTSILFYVLVVLRVVLQAAPHVTTGEWVGQVNLWRPAGMLQCFPIFSLALSCQTNIFAVYTALPDATPAKMNDVVKGAVNLCSAIYITIGFFGYVAFCYVEFAGNILTAFQPSVLIDVIRLCFCVSVALSFPLVLFPCRTSIHSLIFRETYQGIGSTELVTDYISPARFNLITVCVLLVCLTVGILVPDIELVLGLVGSTDTSNFNRHMEKEHGAYFDLDFLLATCFMDKDEKEAVRTVIDAKVVDEEEEDEDEENFVNMVSVKMEHKNEGKKSNQSVAEVKEEKENGMKRGHLELEEDCETTRNKTAKIEVFDCTVCDQRFSETDYLRIHLKIMHSRPESAKKTTEFYCGECDQYFSRKGALNIHMGRKHSDSMTTAVEGLFPCTICDKSYTRKGNLKAHLMTKHEEGRPTPPSSPAVRMVKEEVEVVRRAREEEEEEEVHRRTPSPSWLPPSPAPEVDIASSKYFRLNEYAVCELGAYPGALEAFQPCPELPEGWRVAYLGPAAQPALSTHFLTPCSRVVRSRLGAVEFLRLTGAFDRAQLWAFATSLLVPQKRFDKLF